MKKSALFAAFCGNFIFGFSFIFSKKALYTATPFTLLAWRFLFAFGALCVLAFLGKCKVRFRGKGKFGLLLAMGIFHPILYFVGENYGILYSGATFAAVMIALVPIFSTVFAALFLRERASLGQWIFCAVSISGAIIVSVSGAESGNVSFLGVGLLLLAVFAETGYAYLGRKISATYTPTERTFAMMFCGAVFFGIAAVLENWQNPAALLAPLKSAEFAISLTYLAIFSSVAAFFLLNYAATHLPVAQTVVFSNITTVVSLFAGVVFLHERCGFGSVLGSVLIIVGVWGVQKFAQGATEK